MDGTELWNAYHGGDAAARDELLAKHAALVQYIARDLMKRLRGYVELDDLISAGTIGLIGAIENFDPGRGLAFSTFATPRIRGAILDHLRRWDHVPRSVRRKQRQIANAREKIVTRLGRDPKDHEVADALGIDLETFWRWEFDTTDAVQVALDAPIRSPNGHSPTVEQVLAGDTGAEIAEDVNGQQEREILRAEIMRLSERERQVLGLYYFEELKMHQIADILGVTESRISQIRSGILRKLRSRMGHLREQYA